MDLAPSADNPVPATVAEQAEQLRRRGPEMVAAAIAATSEDRFGTGATAGFSCIILWKAAPLGPWNEGWERQDAR